MDILFSFVLALLLLGLIFYLYQKVNKQLLNIEKSLIGIQISIKNMDSKGSMQEQQIQKNKKELVKQKQQLAVFQQQIQQIQEQLENKIQLIQQKQEYIESQYVNNHDLSSAINMASKGESVEKIVEMCAITEAEAELLIKLHHHKS